VGADAVRVELAVPEAAPLAACEALLSADERARAAKIQVAGARRRFVVGRALLRRALSREAPVAPAAWQLRAAAGGKPELVGPPEGAGLRFNLSHTEGLVACAVVRGVDVGVDVEAARRLRDPLALAERFFAAAEVAALRDLAPPALRDRFLELWTLKEAVLKALGRGIAGGLRTVRVELDGAAPEVHLEGALAGEAGGWQLALLRPTPAHRLALALRSGGRTRPLEIGFAPEFPRA
jgi:4'-phosphopantetheinyl transferase